MPDVDTPSEDTRVKAVRKRGKLPPKGTAARLRYAVGLWSYLSAEEIERIRREIYGSRRSFYASGQTRSHLITRKRKGTMRREAFCPDA